MSVRWIEEPATLGSVRWVGAPLPLPTPPWVKETTVAACQSNLYNQDICYGICSGIGIGGWSGLLVWPCVNQCMIEACGGGILVEHPQMQKVGVQISPCFNACMDAFQQEEVGTDEAALRKAAQQCGQKCGIATITKATAGGKSVPKPGSGGGSKTPPATTTPSPPASAVARAGVGGGLVLLGIGAAVVAGVLAATKR